MCEHMKIVEILFLNDKDPIPSIVNEENMLGTKPASVIDISKKYTSHLPPPLHG